MKTHLFTSGLLAVLLAWPSTAPAAEIKDESKPALAPTPDAKATPTAKATPAPQRVMTGIQWQPSIAAALAEAQRTGKPIMIDFHAEWCGPCHMLDRYTWSNPRIIREAQQWVAVKVDVDQHQATAEKWGVTGLPTTMFLTPNGTYAAEAVGFRPPEMMRRSMKYALKKARQPVVRMVWRD